MSALVELNGAAVFGGRITLPRTGLWRARLSVDLATPPTGAVTLVMGALRLTGVVHRGGAPHGTTDVFIKGGRGGLSVDLPPKAYQTLPLRVVLSDTLQAAGEALSGGATGAELDAFLPAWGRLAGRAVEAVSLILGQAGAVWRAAPDSTLWAGLETWPATKASGRELEAYADAGASRYDLERFDLYPGETLEGRRVGRVEHCIGKGVDTMVWFET